MATVTVTELVSIFCPSCGHPFTHEKKSGGKKIGFWAGVALGAKLGAGVGIVGGPIGAIAGTVPGAIAGAAFGQKLGDVIASSDPKCPNCSVKFKLPG